MNISLNRLFFFCPFYPLNMTSCLIRGTTRVFSARASRHALRGNLPYDRVETHALRGKLPYYRVETHALRGKLPYERSNTTNDHPSFKDNLNTFKYTSIYMLFRWVPCFSNRYLHDEKTHVL